MKILPYCCCTGLCLAAYLALAFVACRDRLTHPMLYAAWCALACAVSIVGVARPAFVESFAAYMLPALAGVGVVFVLAEAARWQQGVRGEEVLLAVALASGFLISFAAGLLDRTGYGRLALQTAAVVVPIVIALAAIGMRPLPEMTPAPAAQSSLSRWGTPAVAVATFRRAA